MLAHTITRYYRNTLKFRFLRYKYGQGTTKEEVKKERREEEITKPAEPADKVVNFNFQENFNDSLSDVNESLDHVSEQEVNITYIIRHCNSLEHRFSFHNSSTLTSPFTVSTLHFPLINSLFDFL